MLIEHPVRIAPSDELQARARTAFEAILGRLTG